MVFFLLLALTPRTTCPSGYAATGPNIPEDCVWVPAENGQGCGPTAHKHAFLLDKQGRYVVNHEKGEPDIVFDGQCHDNDAEFPCTPKITSQGVSTCVDTSRKVLPIQ